MKSLDNKIKYYELLMKYDDTSHHSHYDLPEKYHYEMFKSGDELAWVNIHIKSGEFTSIEQGLEWFHMFYDNFIDELDKRCIFIVDNATNEKIGTATVSLLKEKQCDYDAAIDWVAIIKEYQGKGLAKPLITKFLELAHSLGHKGVILHTQTNTWLAAKLYLDLGFDVLNTTETEGWGILKTLTNHDKLSRYKSIEEKDLYDKTNTIIEKKLINMYQTENFNYAVWTKNWQHAVYTYLNNKHYEYEYEVVDNDAILKEVKTKKYQI